MERNSSQKTKSEAFSTSPADLEYFSDNDSSKTCHECRCAKNIAPKYMIAFVAATWGFLLNIERSIILPTLFLYFKNSWGEKTADKFYGSTLGVFSLSILFATPLFGYASFGNSNVRYLLLFADTLGVIGNVIYLFSFNPWLVFTGRLIAGIGASCESPMYADLTRATLPSERTPYIISLLLTRQVGLIVGPSLTILLKHLDFKIGIFEVNVYNGVGLLLSCLWITHMLLIYFLYPKLDKICDLLDERNGRQRVASERIFKRKNKNLVNIVEYIPSIEDIAAEPSFSSLRQYNILAIYSALFSAYFALMALEASLSPVADRFFNWGEVEVSHVYICASCLIITVSVAMHYMSKYIEDRKLILFGLFILTISYAYLSAVVSGLSNMPIELGATLLLLGITLHIFGAPFTLALSESLYTKLIPSEHQDKAQTVLRTIVNIAYLIGPFIGGTYQRTPVVVFVSMFLVTTVPLLMFTFRFSLFRIPLIMTAI